MVALDVQVMGNTPTVFYKCLNKVQKQNIYLFTTLTHVYQQCSESHTIKLCQLQIF